MNTMRSKKLLITGGLGFIGSAVIRHIINNTDHDVVNVDKLTYAGDLASLTTIENDERYKFEQVDICNSNDVKRVFKEHQPDIVIHLAAESHVDRSINGPGEFIQTNIVGTYILLEEARDYWSGLGDYKKSNFRFHHVSTDEVYGDLEGKNDLFTEETSYAPSSPYSATKAGADLLVQSYVTTFGIDASITRCCNNYGPRQGDEKLIPTVIGKLLEGEAIPVYGNGQNIREWIHVTDHAKAIIEVLFTGNTVGEVYNIPGSVHLSNLDIIDEIIEKVLVYRPELNPSIEFVADRAGHDFKYSVATKYNLAAVRDQRGFNLTDTVEFYLPK